MRSQRARRCSRWRSPPAAGERSPGAGSPVEGGPPGSHRGQVGGTNNKAELIQARTGLQTARAITQIPHIGGIATEHVATARAARSTPSPLGVGSGGRRCRSNAIGEQRSDAKSSRSHLLLHHSPHRWRTPAPLALASAEGHDAGGQRVGLRQRPRAQRKGRSLEQLSNGQVMVKLRLRPRAHRKGRSLEQLSNGQVMVK